MLRWVGIGLVVFCVFFLAPTIGLHSQSWSAWWFAGSTLSTPGVVPITAPPQGPLVAERQGPQLSDMSALMAAIQPYMGVPYVFGGNTRSGIDCSGLTVAVFRALGMSLPRTAQGQYDAVQLVNQPEVGDLVFFQRTYSSPDRITHVGILVAPGVMVSAIEPSVGRQALNTSFWSAHFAGYGRLRK